MSAAVHSRAITSGLTPHAPISLYALQNLFAAIAPRIYSVPVFVSPHSLAVFCEPSTAPSAFTVKSFRPVLHGIPLPTVLTISRSIIAGTIP